VGAGAAMGAGVASGFTDGMRDVVDADTVEVDTFFLAKLIS